MSLKPNLIVVTLIWKRSDYYQTVPSMCHVLINYCACQIRVQFSIEKHVRLC
jgi:hypothetical protein